LASASETTRDPLRPRSPAPRRVEPRQQRAHGPALCRLPRGAGRRRRAAEELAADARDARERRLDPERLHDLGVVLGDRVLLGELLDLVVLRLLRGQGAQRPQREDERDQDAERHRRDSAHAAAA